MLPPRPPNDPFTMSTRAMAQLWRTGLLSMGRFAGFLDGSKAYGLLDNPAGDKIFRKFDEGLTGGGGNG